MFMNSGGIDFKMFMNSGGIGFGVLMNSSRIVFWDNGLHWIIFRQVYHDRFNIHSLDLHLLPRNRKTLVIPTRLLLTKLL